MDTLSLSVTALITALAGSLLLVVAAAWWIFRR
jgi:hypothetical protein